MTPTTPETPKTPSKLMVAHLQEVRRSRDIDDALDYILEAVSLLAASELRLAEVEKVRQDILATAEDLYPETGEPVLMTVPKSRLLGWFTALAPGEPKEEGVT